MRRTSKQLAVLLSALQVLSSISPIFAQQPGLQATDGGTGQSSTQPAASIRPLLSAMDNLQARGREAAAIIRN